MNYPYLGTKVEDGRQLTVFFTEENKGVVVDDTDKGNANVFGLYADFEESEFELLPQNMCVRISN